MIFLSPLYLLFLILIPFLIWVYNIKPHTRAFVVHCIIFGLLIIAIAKPVITTKTVSDKAVLCVDVSPSIPDKEKNNLYSYLSHTNYPIILFDNDAYYIDHPVTARQLTDSHSQVTRGFNALRNAYSILAQSRVGEIFLITDGNFADKEAVLEYANFMKSQNITLHIIPAGMSVEHDIIAGQPIVSHTYSVEVPVRQVGKTSEMTVSLRHDDVILDQKRVSATENTIVPLQGQAPGQSDEIWQVVIDSQAEEYTLQNNTVFKHIIKHDKKRLLRIADIPAGGALASALNKTFEIIDADTEVERNRFIPLAQTFDAILIDDIPAYKLSSSQMRRIYNAVHDSGTGLIVCGLHNSFANGGYSDTIIEKILPVTMAPQPPQKSEDFYILLDTSGSMDPQSTNRQSGLVAATGATKKLLENLDKDDRLAVIAFDVEAREIIPLTSAKQLDNIDTQLDKLSAKGGTDIAAVLRMAYNTIKQNTISKGHIILVSDGKITQQEECIELARLLSEQRKTITAIAIGNDADTEALSQIANIAQGRMYHIDDTGVLPNIFIREKAIASGDYIADKPVPMRITPNNMIYDHLQPDMSLVVNTYTRLSARKDATVLCVAPDGSPLMAYWRAGLGTTAIWASDIEASWMSSWVDSATYASIFTPLYIQVSKNENLSETSNLVSIRILSDQIFIEGSGVPLSIDVTSPSGKTESYDPIIGDKSYYVLIHLEHTGSYIISVHHDKEKFVTRTVTISYPPEFGNLTPDWNFFSAILRISDGKIFNTLDALKEYRSSTVVDKKRSLARWLISLAVLLFIIELMLRKRINLREMYHRIQHEGFRSLFKKKDIIY